MTFPESFGKLILPLAIFGILSGAGLQAQQADQSTTESTQTAEPVEVAEVVSSDTAGWIEMKPSGADAEFKMPTKPRYVERSFQPVADEPSIKVRLHICNFNEGTGGFVFSYHDLHSLPKTAQKIDNVLDGAVAGSITNVQGKPLPQERNGKTATQFKIRYGDHLGREFMYLYAQSGKIYQVSARVFLVGARQYQISALMEQSTFDGELANAYLGTFRLVKPDPEPEIEDKTEAELEPKTEPKSETDTESKKEEEESSK